MKETGMGREGGREGKEGEGGREGGGRERRGEGGGNSLEALNNLP